MDRSQPATASSCPASKAATLESLFDSGYSTGLLSLNSTSFASASSITADGKREHSHRIDSGLCIDSEDNVATDVHSLTAGKQALRFDRKAFFPDEDGDT